MVRGEAGAELRTEANMNVVVGNHRPPLGGPEIAIELRKLSQLAIDNEATTGCVFLSRFVVFSLRLAVASLRAVGT